MAIDNEHDGYPGTGDQDPFEALMGANGLTNESRFQQTAVLSHFVVKRDVLSEMLQDKANFGVFADMIKREGGEFDEV